MLSDRCVPTGVEVDVDRLHDALLRRMEPMPLSPVELTYAQPAREDAALAAALHFGPRQPVKLFVSKLQAELARAEQALREDPRIVCQKGCTACCHYNAVVTAPEVLDLVGYLRAVLPRDALAALTARAQERAAKVHALTAKERWEQRVPCALLSPDGTCLGHRHRPVVCRTYSGADRLECETSAPGAQHHGRMDVIALGTGMTNGLGTGLLFVGLDGNALELTLAVALALTTPGIEARWLAGEPVFEPAYIGLRYDGADEAVQAAGGAA